MNYIEVTRLDGRMARIRTDCIECVFEDERKDKDSPLHFRCLTVMTKGLNIPVKDETLESFFNKMRIANDGRVVQVVGTKDLAPNDRPPPSVFPAVAPAPQIVTQAKKAAAK